MNGDKLSPSFQIINQSIQDINDHIKDLQKQKSRLKKRRQEVCYHENKVYKMGPLRPLSYHAYQDSAFDDHLHPKIYCKDCGKRLS